jgi:hypothetical protein
MDHQQKRTFTGLILLGALYFAVFIWPNSLGARTETMLQATSIDEPITYPYVIRMVTPPKDLREFVNRWLIYGDYHYGYPFYFFSSVSILPVVWIHGASFENYTQINLLLLRQLISVLPMILAVGVLVFSQTHFQSRWKTWSLFIILLSVRALVRNNIQWWHPDALSLLAVVLTLFWLDRDQLRFQRNFYLAGVACAFAIGIKLAGVFFAPLIGGYLLIGLLRKRLSIGQAALKAGVFLGIMLLALFITNPFLINSGAREELVKIQTLKTQQLDLGYTHDDPYYYQKGPLFWEWTLSNWYGQPLLLAFMVISLGAGCLWGPRKIFNRLVLGWAIPYSIYLLWFVAVKPDHYWLPILIPAFSSALSLWDALPAAANRFLKIARLQFQWKHILRAAVAVILVAFIGTNLLQPFAGIITRYQQAIHVEDKFK